MKPGTLLTVLLLICLFSSTISAQPLKEKHLNYLSEHGIELIDSNILYRDVLKDNGKVKMVVIFTNHCAGTPHLFENIAHFKEKFGDKMEYILCSSASKKQLEELSEVLSVNNYAGQVYFIDPARYKEYVLDDRKKGFQFRNDICRPCQEDVIGVPYRIFFSPQNEVLFYGYSSRKDFEKLLKEYFNKP